MALASRKVVGLARVRIVPPHESVAIVIPGAAGEAFLRSEPNFVTKSTMEGREIGFVCTCCAGNEPNFAGEWTVKHLGMASFRALVRQGGGAGQ
jgi:hypothetical protein